MIEIQGTVKFFNRVKAFGFITGEDGNDYFVHKNFLDGDIELSENDIVDFDDEQGERGLKAVNVRKR